MSNKPTRPRTIRCAIYTRKSTEEGLDQQYNSLDSQRDAGEAYIRSQANEGWELVPDRYDDGDRLQSDLPCHRSD
jgi:site-specific DNA recombinase